MKNFLDALNLTDVCPPVKDMRGEKHSAEHDMKSRIINKKTDKKN